MSWEPSIYYSLKNPFVVENVLSLICEDNYSWYLWECLPSSQWFPSSLGAASRIYWGGGGEAVSAHTSTAWASPLVIAYWNRTGITSKAEPIRSFLPGILNWSQESQADLSVWFLNANSGIEGGHISPSGLEEQKKSIRRKNKAYAQRRAQGRHKGSCAFQVPRQSCYLKSNCLPALGFNKHSCSSRHWHLANQTYNSGML